MVIFQKIGQRVLLATQFTLVFIYILFEEIIWESLARPIYYKIQSLKILQKLQQIINRVDNYTRLAIFITLLLTVEGIGVLAGVSFLRGKIILGGLLYSFKVPLAGFTFWFFKISKDRFLSFKWFSFIYYRFISLIEWLKSTDIYRSSIGFLLKLRDRLKEIKKRFFSKESSFIYEMKSFYYYIKNFKNRNR